MLATAKGTTATLFPKACGRWVALCREWGWETHKTKQIKWSSSILGVVGAERESEFGQKRERENQQEEMTEVEQDPQDYLGM